jgi:hypothetical protein
LQILHRQESAGLEFAFDNEIFDPLAGQIEEVQSVLSRWFWQRGFFGRRAFSGRVFPAGYGQFSFNSMAWHGDMLFFLEATSTDMQVWTLKDGRLKIEAQADSFHGKDKPVLDLRNGGDKFLIPTGIESAH